MADSTRRKPPLAAYSTRLAVSTVRALAPSIRPSPRAVAVRAVACLAALLAIGLFAGETGHNAYRALNYPVLIYAGLSLPWPIVAGLVLWAAIGPSPHGSFFTTVQHDQTVTVRPVALAIVAATSLALARTSRRREDTLRASERRLFSFLESMPLGVFVLSIDGTAYYANHTAQKLLGQDVVPGMDTKELVSIHNSYVAGTNEPYPLSRRPAVRALKGETSVAEDLEIEGENGRINLKVWGAPIRDDSGQITHSVTAFSNITAQKRFEAALQESEARFRTVFEEGPLGMAIADLDYRYVQVNQAFCDMTGYRGDELAGLTFADITHPEDHDLHTRQTSLMEEGELEVMDIEKRYIRKDGETIWVRACVRLIHNAAGSSAYHLSMIQDITAQRQALEQVERMANHDFLTGLPNRRLLYDRLSQAIARAKRYDGAVVVLSVNLDGFKLVNDTYGHAAGDAMLIETGKRLREALRDTDTVARMGGDEFVMLLSEASRGDTDTIVRRIESSFAEPMRIAGAELQIRPSIGRAALFEDGDTEDALISAADAERRRNKESRRLRAS